MVILGVQIKGTTTCDLRPCLGVIVKQCSPWKHKERDMWFFVPWNNMFRSSGFPLLVVSLSYIMSLSSPRTWHPDGWVCSSTLSHKTGMFCSSPCLRECRSWTYLSRAMEVSFLELMHHSPLTRSTPEWWPSPKWRLHRVFSYTLFFFLVLPKINLLSGGRGSDRKGDRCNKHKSKVSRRQQHDLYPNKTPFGVPESF